MKGKYITRQLMITCLSGRDDSKKDIHLELEQTINDRKEIIRKLEAIARRAEMIRMYLQISEAA